MQVEPETPCAVKSGSSQEWWGVSEGHRRQPRRLGELDLVFERGSWCGRMKTEESRRVCGSLLFYSFTFSEAWKFLKWKVRSKRETNLKVGPTLINASLWVLSFWPHRGSGWRFRLVHHTLLSSQESQGLGPRPQELEGEAEEPPCLIFLRRSWGTDSVWDHEIISILIL